MEPTTTLEAKIALVREVMGDLIGNRLVKYKTAELQLIDGTWVAWPDMPIRLYADSGAIVSVSWSRFGDLWIERGQGLPFATDDATLRWVTNGITPIEPAIGNRMKSVMIGRGEMTWDGREVEIWTRLLVEFDGGWLEVFNALDEHEYAFHTRMPSGTFLPCV